MKRGRGRPPKTPTFSSKILNSGRRGSHHGGPSSPRVSSPQGVKTRDSNRSIQRKNYFEGIQFSESDSDSDSSYESSVSSVPSYKSPHRLRVIPMRSVTPLKLPPSSDDIILPPEHVLQALSIYEVLRQFGRILRLSPFRYEDFCAAIDSAEQSVLLSQIHMALSRALLLEDETNGYTFAASDEKDSLNIFLHEVDCFTWPEHIRSYFFSDKSEFGDLFDLVCGRDHNNPFPFVSIEDRLKALKRLCDLFLASNTVREVIINEGITESEDHCRSCCKMGDLLCCENCPAVYHLHCLKPPLEIVPEGDWLCPICDEHRLKGVTECHTDWTKDGWLRHTPIGTDREGRKYWFLSRRLFVESEDETVRYYSSKTHFDELIEYLEVDGQERRLLSALKTKYTTIVKHMAITMSLVEASRGNMTSGLLPRRKDVEEKKSTEAVADQETVKEEETSPKVSLTFVPDTAVVKMVTKGNQESPNEVESDRRLIAMKQHEEIKEGEANSEEMEEGENSSPGSIDTNSKTLGKQLDIDGNESVKREAIDLSCASDVQMDSESPEQIKTETNSSQKSEENTTEKISDNISDDTSCDKSVLLNKQPDNVDSPINATTSSGSSAVSLHSVRKVIDFGSSESSQTLGTETKETDPCKDDSETKHLVQNNDVEQNNKKDNDPDLIKPVKQELQPENPETEPINQGTEMEVPKDEESKMKTEEVIKQEGDQGQEEDKKEIKEKENKPTIKPEMPEPKGPFFRLGMEGNFTAYVNQYATNPLALNKNQHMEYKERKRSVNNKFSVEHEFKISGEIFGPKDVILNTLRCSIVNLENNIPAAFMHPIWPLQRSTWVRAVHIATTPEEFGAVLIFLESLIRPLCFIPVWRDALGHVELHRAIVETKAERAARKREHKEEDEEVEVQHRALVNYSWVPMHQIWKQKGEEYRIFKGGGWTWHSGMSARKRKHCFTKDRREFECKKRKLCKVVDNFINKREEKKKEAERRAKAKLAVQAYKENMKSTQSVTQGNIVKQVVSTPKPSNAANTGVQLSKVSQSMATSAAVQQGLSVVNVPGGIKYLLQSGSSTTQSSSLTQVTQSMSIPKVTPSTGATQGTPSVVVPQLSALVQVTKSSSVPKVTQSVVVPQVTQLPGVMQVTQSSSVPKVTLSAGATQVTQSIVVPQVTQLSGVMEVTQSSSVPKVTPSAGVTQVTQSIVVPQVTQLPSVMQVTQSSSIPKVTPSAGVTQVTQSVVVPQAPQFSGVVQVTQSSSVPKVTTSADVTQVMQSTGAPLVTPLSGVLRVTQSTSMPQVAHSAGVTQLTQSLGVPQVSSLSGVVRVTETTSIPKVTLSAGVTQVTQSLVAPQVTPFPGVVQVTQSTTAPKVTHSKDVALDQQSTHDTVNQTVNDMTKVPASPKEEVVSHVSNVIGIEPQKDVIQISSLVQPTLLSGLTQSAALAQTLPITTGLQPLVTSIVHQKSETVPVNVMSNDIMPKLSNVTQPTLEFSDSKATQSVNSTVTNSSNSNPDLMGSSAVHRDAVQAKDSEQRCSGTKTSPTLSQTLLANDSTEVSTKPGSTQGNALDIPDSSSDVKTASSNSHDILLLTDKMDTNLVPPSDELLNDKMDTNLVPPSDELLNDESKNDTVSSANKEGFPNESYFSSAKCTIKSAEQDGLCSVASHCTYDLTEDDDWIIIQSNKHLKQMDSSRTSVNNSKSYNCLPSSNAVDVDLTDSLLNIRNETKKETSENALANSIDIHEENRTTLDLNIPRKTTVEYNSGEDMSNDKQTTQDNISSHNTEEKSDLNTFSASKNVSSSSANVPGSPQLLLDSQTLVTSSQATSSNCQDTSYCNRSQNTSNPESSKVGNSSSTQSFVRPSATSSDNLTAETQVVSTAPSSIASTPNTTFATFTATPTVTAPLSTSSKNSPVLTPLATAQSSSSENMAVETKDVPSLTLRESTFVDTQATSLVSTPVSTSAESMDVDTQDASLAAVTPSSSTLTESIALKSQATSVTLATPSLTLCQSTTVVTQATSLAALKPSSSTLAESITVNNHEKSGTEVAPPTTFSESASVATQATALAVASTSSVFNQNIHVNSQGTSVSATVQSSTLTTKSTSVATQPTPLDVTAELSKDIPVITQVKSNTDIKPHSSVVTTVAAQPKSFTAAAQSSLISSQHMAQKTKGTLLTVLASPTSTALTQIPPLSVTVPSATLRQSTSSVNQATQPSVNAVSSSQIRNLLTQATLPVTVSSDSTSSSQNVTLITQAALLPSSQNSNVASHTALLSSPSSAASVPLKSLASVSTAAIPASTINLSGLPITASSLKSVPITSSGVVKVAQGVIQDPKNNVNVTSSSQESLGMTLTKTLINTAMKASQNVPVGSAAKQVTVASTQKIAQPKVVKTVSATRPQVIAAKPTQQLRAIAPQPRAPLIQAGQTTVLQNSPQTSQINFPLLSGNTLQGGVVKISTPGVSNPGTPVNNIAALVASLPGNAGTPGQPQLIRFVTPSGASFTVQGTIQPGPQGSAAGSTTINVPKRLLASSLPAVTKPVVVAPKTVGATTNRTTVTIPRSQQPVVPKVTKTASTPEKKENYPVLEPLVKDPRKLINRVMSKWRNNRCSVKSVFQLKKHERRILGRRAGMREVPGYMYVTRGSGINWPPSFPRPSFKVAWRYRSRSLRTLAGAGLQARILHACLKWEDINIRPPRSNSSTICTGTGTTSSEVINHRYVTPDGLKCEYLVRKIVRTMRKPAPEIPRPPPPTVSKRGRTLRPKINLQPDDEDEDEIIHTGPRVFESWCPESELELWEVRQYNERKEREKALEREKKLQEEASRRAAELRAAAIQRRQQEQQAKQQQQILKKKVQNAIKTQQKKLTNVSQATTRAGYKPITMETMAASGITSAQVIRPATVPRQQVPQVTNLVTQYRPASLKQTRVPIGSPATGMIRTVTRAQVNYRPLATTTQAKMSTPGVTPTVKSVSNIPYVARGLGMNAPKMKHSSKELQQAKQQIAKAKGKKSGGTGVGPSASKKHVPLETRQELNRIGVCKKLIDHLISKIERSEEQERNKESKRKAVAQKQQRAKANKLDGILYKRKELLKKEIIRKRAVLEKELTLELSKESKKETPTKKRKRESSFGSVGDVLHDKKQKTAEEVYCICRKPYDPTMFYIGCDLCANWFHGECVGVTPESAEAMEQFTCSECSKAQQGVETEELYCLCRQPYDEAKFYIGCDTCHDWFHGSCVGITEGEAEMLDSYFCPRCKESQSSRDVQPLSNKDYDSLKRLLRSLQSHKMAWPFLEPVSADDVPGYYDIIKEPMDLSKVEDRLSTKHYHTVEQFNADITTMFDNCRFFNPKESPYYRCAEVLEGFFVKKLRAWQKKA